MNGLQVCQCKPYKVTASVKFNPLMLVNASNLHLKVQTSVSELNFTPIVTTSDFEKDLYSQACKMLIRLKLGFN